MVITNCDASEIGFFKREERAHIFEVCYFVPVVLGGVVIVYDIECVGPIDLLGYFFRTGPDIWHRWTS